MPRADMQHARSDKLPGISVAHTVVADCEIIANNPWLPQFEAELRGKSSHVRADQTEQNGRPAERAIAHLRRRFPPGKTHPPRVSQPRKIVDDFPASRC